MRYFEIATQLSGFFFAQDLRLVTHLTRPAPPAKCVCLISAIGTGFLHVPDAVATLSRVTTATDGVVRDVEVKTALPGLYPMNAETRVR